MLSRLKSVLFFCVSIAAGLAVWQIATIIVDNPLALVSPLAVFQRIATLILSGEIWPHFVASMSAFVYGYVLAVIFGVICGLVLAESPLLRTFFDPWLDALYATPMIVFAPIFVVVLGIGISSKVAVVFLVSFFPIVITTIAGARLIDRTLLDMGRSFGFSRMQIARKIRAPFALPAIIAGLRVASARGLVGVVVGELFGARAGLGYLVVAASQNFDTVGMYAGGVMLIICGVAINMFFRWLEQYLAPWKST